MTRDEAKTFIGDKLQQLWPKWEPTQAILAQWLDVIQPLTEDEAQAAANKLYRGGGGKYNSPNIKEYAGCIVRTAPRENTLTGTGVHWTGVFAVCVEHDALPARVGWRQHVTIHCQHQPNAEQIMNVAQRICQQRAATYGGRWAVQQTERKPQKYYPCKKCDEATDGRACHRKKADSCNRSMETGELYVLFDTEQCKQITILEWCIKLRRAAMGEVAHA